MFGLILFVAVIALFAVAFILNIKKSPKPETPTPKPQFVTYHSNKRGERIAKVLGRRNGHLILHVNGHPYNVTVRRRPHLCTSVN